MAKTSIEWADDVLNGLRGRRRKSPGCGGGVIGPNGEKGGCYAEGMAARLVRMGGYEWDVERGDWIEDPSKKWTPASRETADKYRLVIRLDSKDKAQWTGAYAFDADKLSEALTWRKPRRVFVNSMSDLFGEGVTNEQIAARFAVFAATPHITYLTLTKRAERMPEWFAWVEQRAEDGRRMFPDDSREWRIWQMLYYYARKLGVDVPPHHGGAWPLPNVHLGVSVERQKEADERLPHLVECPATVRWVSAEPLLGPVDIFAAGMKIDGKLDVTSGERRRLDWVVWGGESGNGARPCDVQWIREGVKQCRAAGVPAFVKQLGTACYDFETATAGRLPDGFMFIRIRHEVTDKKGANPAEWPEDLRVREWPAGFTPPKSEKKKLPVVGAGQ